MNQDNHRMPATGECWRDNREGLRSNVTIIGMARDASTGSLMVAYCSSLSYDRTLIVSPIEYFLQELNGKQRFTFNLSADDHNDHYCPFINRADPRDAMPVATVRPLNGLTPDQYKREREAFCKYYSTAVNLDLRTDQWGTFKHEYIRNLFDGWMTRAEIYHTEPKPPLGLHTLLIPSELTAEQLDAIGAIIQREMMKIPPGIGPGNWREFARIAWRAILDTIGKSQ